MLQLDFSSFPEIETQTLLLRRMTKDDVNELFLMRSSDDVMKYIDRPRALSVKDAEAFLEVIDASLQNNTGITWGICFKNDPSKLLGTIGYWRLVPQHYRAEIGYMLLPDYWQKGIMKEALFALVDYAFTTMNLHSIEANLNAGNIASERLLKSAGFVKEAHFKEDFFFNGIFMDSIIYSKVKATQ